jgi:hypothetical protein
MAHTMPTIPPFDLFDVSVLCRDSFFTRAEFSQLLFAACTPWKPGADSNALHKQPLLRLKLS